MNLQLTPAAEQKLRSLGNKHYYRTLILTGIWLILVIAAFAVYMISSKRSFAEPQNYLVLILCILPFFPLGAHKVLFSKTFYATVSYGVHGTQFESLKWASPRNRPTKADVLELTFKRDDGKEIMISYKKSAYPGKGFHYAEGDRVLFVRGLKYPYKLPAAQAEKFTCPRCGTTVEADHPICRGCRLDLSELMNP